MEEVVGLPKNRPYALDPDRAREIAEECYGEVLAYCRRHAPAGHEPDDLAQETFLRFVRAGSYRERGKPIAYLMRIARSVCVDASRRRRLETVALDFDVADSHSEDALPELGEALSKLTREQREALELRYGSGLSVNETALALGVSRFTVRRRVNSALKQLSVELKEGGLSD